MNINDVLKQLDNGNHLSFSEIKQALKELNKYMQELQNRLIIEK